MGEDTSSPYKEIGISAEEAHGRNKRKPLKGGKAAESGIYDIFTKKMSKRKKKKKRPNFTRTQFGKDVVLDERMLKKNRRAAERAFKKLGIRDELK